MDLLARRIDFLRKHVRLTQVMDHFGHRYRLHGNMLCPFHEEKNPSARLYVDQDTFWCWVCSPEKGVDVIEYVMLELTLIEDLKSSLPRLDPQKLRALATFKAIEYLETEFGVSFLMEPWETRLYDALRRELPKEDPARYWRNSHIHALRVLSNSKPNYIQLVHYSEAIAQLLPLRNAPIAEQRPLWNELRSLGT